MGLFDRLRKKHKPIRQVIHTSHKHTKFIRLYDSVRDVNKGNVLSSRYIYTYMCLYIKCVCFSFQTIPYYTSRYTQKKPSYS